MIGIIDYGMGNIHSVQKALELSGARTLIINKAQDLKKCAKIVLPGVGAFDDAVSELRKKGLILGIKKYIVEKKPFLGICLGMQLLFEESLEAKKEKGLGLFKGRVKKFKPAKNFNVPHMGWNQLEKSKIQNPKSKNQCPLLKNIPDGANVYFCHSYYPDPKDRSVIAATTNYAVNFASVVWKDNIFGVQFHPEKSQAVGLRILKNFIKI